MTANDIDAEWFFHSAAVAFKCHYAGRFCDSGKRMRDALMSALPGVAGQAIADLPVDAWTGPFTAEVRAAALSALENGLVLFARSLAFRLAPDEQPLLSPELSDGKAKNISYDPATGKVGGARAGAPEASLAAMMRRFADDSQNLILGLFPGYVGALVRARTSYRSCEIAGRPASWRKDDTRLHVDAFPSRPMRGRRILRVFSNIDPAGTPRLWRVGEPFADFASRFLTGIPRPSPFQSGVLAALGITKGRRSGYDHYMLALHDAAKASPDYQRTAPQVEVGFPAGSTWICYSDQVLHAAHAGKFCMEQTFHLDAAAMAMPEQAPLRVLERLTRQTLA